MREVVIQVWCDAHGRGTEATYTTPAVDGKVMDLCAPCYTQVCEPWLELLHEHGVEPEPEPPRKCTAAKPEACPVCGEQKPSRRALGAHLRTEHNRSIKEFAKRGEPLPATPHLRSTA